MPVKVSVVMATYNSGSRLMPAIDSVLAQSLPPDEYELVIVDDGSTDGTADRARAVAAEHPQVLVEQIPNSGWPGRPRNLGTRRARGEYVLYMDHDDDLPPQALEHAHRFASEHRADVLLAKEVGVGGRTPGWDTFRESVGCVERVDQRVLQSMTPHKYYRRQFLLDRDVRFPEGRIRLEDYDFNAQAYVRAERIAVLADQPCYRWHHHKGSARSAPFPLATYWASFDHSLLAPEQELPPGPEQDEYLLRWYRSRVLGRVGPPFRRWSPARRDEWWQGLRASLRHFPEHLDGRLLPRERLRAHLLRTGDKDRLVQLAEADDAWLEAGTGTATWVDGALTVTLRAGVVRRDGAPVAFVRRGDRVLRLLPEDLVAGVPDDVLAVEDALPSATVELTVRGRTSGVEWPVPSQGSVELVEGPAGRLHLDLRVSGTVHPGTGAMGAPLADEVWSVRLRVAALGYRLTVPVPAVAARPQPALVDGRPVVAYRTRTGRLAVDVGGRQRSLVDDARPRQRGVRWRRGGARLVVRLPRLHVSGAPTVKAALLLPGSGRRVPARLRVVDGRARLVGRLPRPTTTGEPVQVLLAGRTGRARLVLPARPARVADTPGRRVAQRVGRLVPGLAARVPRRPVRRVARRLARLLPGLADRVRRR